MRVRVKAGELTSQQRAQLGGSLAKVGRTTGRVGTEFTVLGIVVGLKSRTLGTGPWIVYQDAEGNPLISPLALFDVIDSTVPPTWSVQVNTDRIALWPEDFEEEHFLEDAAEPNTVARKSLDSIRARLGNSERAR